MMRSTLEPATRIFGAPVTYASAAAVFMISSGTCVEIKFRGASHTAES